MIHYCLSIHTSNTLVYQELLSLAVIMQSYVVFNVALIFMGLNCISDWVELWSEHRLHHGCRIAELWPIPDQGTILDRLRFTWRRYDFTIQSHNLSKNLYNEKRKVLLTDNLNKIEIQSIEMKAPQQLDFCEIHCQLALQTVTTIICSAKEDITKSCRKYFILIRWNI